MDDSHDSHDESGGFTSLYIPASSDVQSLGFFNQQEMMGQVIDLGTPSSSPAPEDDAGLLGDDIVQPTPRSSAHESSPSQRAIVPAPGSMAIRSVELPSHTLAAISPIVWNSQPLLGDTPEHASIATVSRWTWAQLIDTQDRKRIVSKAMHGMSSSDREMIRQRLEKVGRTTMVREIPICVDMLIRWDARMPGILPEDALKIVKFTKLFLCWWLGGNYCLKVPPQERLEELAECLRQHSPDPATFCDYVATILTTTFSRTALSNPARPSQSEIIEISDDD